MAEIPKRFDVVTTFELTETEKLDGSIRLTFDAENPADTDSPLRMEVNVIDAVLEQEGSLDSMLMNMAERELVPNAVDFLKALYGAQQESENPEA